MVALAAVNHQKTLKDMRVVVSRLLNNTDRVSMATFGLVFYTRRYAQVERTNLAEASFQVGC
jgi:hypothetical protein